MGEQSHLDVSAAFAKLKPESVLFVLSLDGNRPSGMVACWHMCCSKEPPLLAVALSKEGYTHKLIRKTKEFVLAAANQELINEVEFFGSTHGNEVDKFAETKLETVPAETIKVPLIKKATINFECTLEKEVDAGDHWLFLGRVKALHLNPEKKVLFNLGRINGKRVFKEL